MKQIAVFKESGKLFAVFASLKELCRVLSVREEDVMDCLNGTFRVAYAKETPFRTLRMFEFREIDDSKKGQC